MAQPKRKTSKMKKRIRKSAQLSRNTKVAVAKNGQFTNAYVIIDPVTGEAKLPHRINPTTGEYKGRQYSKAVAE